MTPAAVEAQQGDRLAAGRGLIVAVPVPAMTDEQKARFWANVDKSADCWLWTAGTVGDGYGCFHVGKLTLLAHRVSLALHGREDIGLCAMHSCDVPRCVNPSHLSFGTNADNARDRASKGRNGSHLIKGSRNGTHTMSERRPIGERHGRSKIRDNQVPAIRNDPRTQIVIAAEYGVNRAIISRIKRRQLWAHIGDAK